MIHIYHCMTWDSHLSVYDAVAVLRFRDHLPSKYYLHYTMKSSPSPLLLPALFLQFLLGCFPISCVSGYHLLGIFLKVYTLFSSSSMFSDLVTSLCTSKCLWRGICMNRESARVGSIIAQLSLTTKTILSWHHCSPLQTGCFRCHLLPPQAL